MDSVNYTQNNNLPQQQQQQQQQSQRMPIQVDVPDWLLCNRAFQVLNSRRKLDKLETPANNNAARSSSQPQLQLKQRSRILLFGPDAEEFSKDSCINDRRNVSVQKHPCYKDFCVIHFRWGTKIDRICRDGYSKFSRLLIAASWHTGNIFDCLQNESSSDNRSHSHSQIKDVRDDAQSSASTVPRYPRSRSPRKDDIGSNCSRLSSEQSSLFSQIMEDFLAFNWQSVQDAFDYYGSLVLAQHPQKWEMIALLTEKEDLLPKIMARMGNINRNKQRIDHQIQDRGEDMPYLRLYKENSSNAFHVNGNSNKYADDDDDDDASQQIEEPHYQNEVASKQHHSSQGGEILQSQKQSAFQRPLKIPSPLPVILATAQTRGQSEKLKTILLLVDNRNEKVKRDDTQLP